MKLKQDLTRAHGGNGFSSTIARGVLNNDEYCKYVCNLYLNKDYKVITRNGLKIKYLSQKICDFDNTLIDILRHKSTSLLDEIIISIKSAVDSTVQTNTNIHDEKNNKNAKKGKRYGKYRISNFCGFRKL